MRSVIEMEFSVHRQLKEQFSGPEARTEVRLGSFRIDVVDRGRLIEIQHSPLASIREKVATLLKSHGVDIVKPIVARKQIVRLQHRDGEVASVRWSPQRRTMLAIFDELLHFTRVFPHRHLRLVVPLIEVQELRYPGHGRRRRWSSDDFIIADRRLERTLEVQEFRTAADLWRLLPADLSESFDTLELASLLSVSRNSAQKIAYVLRETGGARQVGKRGNRLVYRLEAPKKKGQRRA